MGPHKIAKRCKAKDTVNRQKDHQQIGKGSLTFSSKNINMYNLKLSKYTWSISFVGVYILLNTLIEKGLW